MLQLDPTTQASLEAATTPNARAAAIVSSLSGTITVTVRDGTGSTKGSGTMASFGTLSANVIVLNNVTSFTVSETGSPDPATWTIEFANAGGRFVKGTFGLYTSPVAEFKWSLATWENGQSGTIANAYCTVAKQEVLSDAVDSFDVAAPPVNVGPVWATGTPTTLTLASGATYNFAQHAYDANGDTLTFSKISGTGQVASNGVFTAGTTSGSISIRVSDGVLSADTSCAVTVPLQTLTDLATLRTAGYKIVTDYPNVYPNSPTQDSRAGIQAAIDECGRLGYPLYFPSGTYYVGDTLFMILWARNTGVGTWSSSPFHHSLIGNAQSRPVIKVMSSATAFNSTSITRPVICCRAFDGVTANAASYPNPYIPSWLYADPLSESADWKDGYGIGFWEKLTNFVVDTSGKAGAIGIFWGTCQNSWLTNIKVIATGSDIAFAGIGGTQGSVDLEAIGGKYGAFSGKIRQANIASGMTGVAVRLYDQTVAAVRFSDYTPNGIVGFHIRVGAGAAPFDIVGGTTNTAATTPYFIDGIIECAGQVAMTNSNNTFYARNVYVTGTDDIIKTGSLSTVTGTGTWKRIVEYSARNPNGLAGGTFGSYPQLNLIHRALINGSFNSNQQVIANVQSSASAPPSDLVSKHSPVNQTPWLFDGLPYVNVLDYGAVRYVHEGSENLAFEFGKAIYRDANWAVIIDNAPAINAAIAAAEAAGHNRVLIPRGVYHVGSTINMRANTKLFGVGAKHSTIAVRNTWVPTNSPNYVVASESNKDGTASLTDAHISIPTQWGALLSNGQYSGARHSHVLWRTGRRSMTWNVSTGLQYYDETQPANDRQVFTILGPNGGGRHYFMEEDGRCNTFTTHRCLLMRNTIEPTSIYAASFETFKTGNSAIWAEFGTDWTIELDNCDNVRIYINKREGNAGTIRIKDCDNAAIWGPGVNMTTIHNEPWYTRTLIDGASDNILVALQTNQAGNYASTNRFMLTESITGQPEVKIPNWEGIALYKRGEINDSLMVHT